MKIALVVERFEPGAGGVESVAHHLAAQLGRRREHVTVVCRQVGAPIPAGVQVECVPVPRFWQPLRISRFSVRAARATAHGFDVVHGFSRTRHQHVYRAGGGSHAAYMERMYRRPELRRRFSSRHRTILRIEEAVFADPRQLVQCNSHMVAAEIAERYEVPEERLVVVHNGVDSERFHPDRRRRERTRTRADLGVDGPVALFVGHAFERKGLARAIRGLADAGTSTTLLVAGRGDPQTFQRQAQRLGVAARVRFLGPRTDVEALYAACDLLVLPTHYDAFANACLEAMAAGLPVATTRTNGVSELIRHGENGLLYDENFAPAYRELVGGGGERLAGMGRAARCTAEQYTWSRHTDAVLELYARIRS